MVQNNKEILDAIEYSLFMYPGVEGVYEEYKHDSIKGYVCPTVDFEELNRVGMARLTEEETDSVLKEVIEFYTSKGLKKIGWMLSTQSQPSNLEEKLIEHGFTKEIPVLGMSYPIEKELELETTEEFRFEKYSKEEAIELIKNPEFQSLYEKAYGAPEGTGQLMAHLGDMYKGLDIISFVAYDKETDKPVGFGGIGYIPKTNCAVLNGAATLPEYRKRGIYSALLRIRYDQAKSDGIEHLVIQAKEGTSAPIAEKNGFEKVCELPFYVWRASEE